MPTEGDQDRASEPDETPHDDLLATLAETVGDLLSGEAEAPPEEEDQCSDARSSG